MFSLVIELVFVLAFLFSCWPARIKTSFQANIFHFFLKKKWNWKMLTVFSFFIVLIGRSFLPLGRSNKRKRWTSVSLGRISTFIFFSICNRWSITEKKRNVECLWPRRTKWKRSMTSSSKRNEKGKTARRSLLYFVLLWAISWRPRRENYEHLLPRSIDGHEQKTKR